LEKRKSGRYVIYADQSTLIIESLKQVKQASDVLLEAFILFPLSYNVLDIRTQNIKYDLKPIVNK